VYFPFINLNTVLPDACGRTAGFKARLVVVGKFLFTGFPPVLPLRDRGGSREVIEAILKFKSHE